MQLKWQQVSEGVAALSTTENEARETAERVLLAAIDTAQQAGAKASADIHQSIANLGKPERAAAEALIAQALLSLEEVNTSLKNLYAPFLSLRSSQTTAKNQLDELSRVVLLDTESRAPLGN